MADTTTNTNDTNEDPEAMDKVKLKAALSKERTLHKATADALKAAKAELIAANEKVNVADNPTGARVAEHIAASVKAATAQATAAMQQQIAELQGKLTDAEKNGTDLLGKLTSRTISEEVREAARAAHVLDSALPDALTMGSLELKMNGDRVETEDGRSVEEWIDSAKASRPYWFPLSRSAGARGSMGDGGNVFTGKNPFAAETFNLTEQSRLVQSQPDLAKRLQQEVQQ